MANKRQLTKMGQTARKATFDPNASKKAKAVAVKAKNIQVKSANANSDGIKSPKLLKKGMAVATGIVNQVVKEEKKRK